MIRKNEISKSTKDSLSASQSSSSAYNNTIDNRLLITRNATVKRHPSAPNLLRSNYSNQNVSPSATYRSGSKIEPHVYTDTQSKGLTSRIVMYYEKNRKDMPKPIINRKYNRPGEFPIVHINKGDAVSQLKRSQLTTGKGKITTPENSAFLKSSRSEILRTGSLLSLDNSSHSQQSHSTLGHDIENNIAPLDALKEISRKRIHCEDLDSDQTKKQKAEKTQDHTDAPLANSASGAINKRQRETISPNVTNASNDSQKKRFCTKNNDILSSLSSSLFLVTPKRKPEHLERRGSAPLLNVPQPDSLFEINAEISRRPSIDNATLPHTLKNTPHLNNKHNVVDDEDVMRKEIIQPKIPTLTLFNKSYDNQNSKEMHKAKKTTTNSTDDDDEDEGSQISYIKPRQPTQQAIISAKTSEKSKLSLMLSCLSGDPDESDEEDVVDKSEVADTNNLPTNETSADGVKSVGSEKSETTPKTIAPSVSSLSQLQNNPIKDNAVAPLNSILKVSIQPSGASIGQSNQLSTVISSSSSNLTDIPPKTTQKQVNFSLSGEQNELSTTTTTATSSLPSAKFNFGVTDSANKTGSPAAVSLGNSSAFKPIISVNSSAAANNSNISPVVKPISTTSSFNITQVTSSEAEKGTPNTSVTSLFGIGTWSTNISFGNKSLVTSQMQAATTTSLNPGSAVSTLSFGQTQSTASLIKPTPSFNFASNVTSTATNSIGTESTVSNVTSTFTNQPMTSFSFGGKSTGFGTNITSSASVSSLQTVTPVDAATNKISSPSSGGFGINSSAKLTSSNLFEIKPTVSSTADNQSKISGPTPTFGGGQLGGSTAAVSGFASQTSSSSTVVPSTFQLTSNSSISFGTQSTVAPVFGGQKSTTTAAAAFGNQSNTVSQSAGFGTLTKTSSAFGEFQPTNATKSTVSLFGQSNTTGGATTVFGGGNNQTTSPFEHTSKAMFGGSQTSAAPIFGSSDSTAFKSPTGFEKPKTTATSSVFGSNSANLNTSFSAGGASNTGVMSPLFGQAAFGNPTQSTTTGSTNLFSTTSAPATHAAPSAFSFSAKPSTLTTPGPAPAQPAPSAFSFSGSSSNGPSANAGSSNMFSFGGDSSKNKPPAFGQSQQQQTNQPTSPFSFSTNQQQNSSAVGTFGNIISSANKTTSPFGSASQPPLFGAAASPQISASTFGGAAQSSVPAFGGSAQSSAPSFGGSSQFNGSSSSGAFTFGSTATNNTTAAVPPTNSSFAFGTASPQTSNNSFSNTAGSTPSAAPFAFGGSSSGGSTASPSSNTFNFSSLASGVGGGVAGPQTPPVNLFSAGPNSNAQKLRPIRQATRRMK